jgi:hypothetical protein
MWLFTQDGFVSTVENKKKPGTLMVRARDRQSLELVSTLTGEEIVVSPGHDYAYRVFVTREQFAEFLVANAYAIDYGNFKDRVWGTRGDVWHDAAGSVWAEMLAVTDEEARTNGYGIYTR